MLFVILISAYLLAFNSTRFFAILYDFKLELKSLMKFIYRAVQLLTAAVLISRLINAHCHLLALRISEYLGMKKEVVIMHWACAKITASSSTPDSHLLEILLDKLQLCKGISYAAVATHADNCNRRKLAALLVEHEPRSTKQVPLLLRIGEEDTASVKATESGDTDLILIFSLAFNLKECNFVSRLD